MASATTVHGKRGDGRAISALRSPVFLRLASSVASALITGILVGGLGGRLVMRFSAMAADDSRIGLLTENGNRIGSITGEGTLALVIFVGLATGLSMGLFLFGLRTMLPARWLPLSVSIVLLGLGSSTVIDPGNADFTIVGNRALNVAMFLVLFPAFGVVSIWLAEGLERWLVRPPLVRIAPLTVAGTWLGLVLGLAGMAFVISQVAFGGAILSLVVILSITIAAGNARVASTARSIALVLLVVATTLGLVGLARDVVTIVG
ncbi:MAG: hypothetical protein OEV60_06690 [Actinomycetota bacterium]|nr:hypothetical protein [Actinomycetota bacterium]MDH5225586.1 hypothetical protein [Actinomycetota bacterium]